MTSGLTIRVDDLVTALRRVLDEVAIKHGAEIELQDDYYWTVPTDAAFNMSIVPVDFTAGQLTDDTQSIRQFLRQPLDEPISVWHELAHLVGVLRGIEQLDRRPT